MVTVVVRFQAPVVLVRVGFPMVLTDTVIVEDIHLPMGVAVVILHIVAVLVVGEPAFIMASVMVTMLRIQVEEVVIRVVGVGRTLMDLQVEVVPTYPRVQST